MRKLLWPLITALLVCVSAQASGYDSYARGVNAYTRDDPGNAITEFTAALQAGDLVPAYVPAAYRGRAIAYWNVGRCQEAMTDLTAADKLRPLNMSGIILRARIKLCLQDAAGALADFDTAAGSVPEGELYWQFGIDCWSAGYFEQADHFLSQAPALLSRSFKNNRAPWMLLWQAMVSQRLGRFDAKALDAQLGKVNTYTAPSRVMELLQLYLGKRKPDDLLGRIGSPANSEYTARSCEGAFYAGEWYLIHNETEAGKAAIANALTACTSDYFEYGAARAEAKRLKLTIPGEGAP